MDKGPWKVQVSYDRFIRVESADFTHYVSLILTGDFEDRDQGIRYAEWLRDTLNKATANGAEP